MYCVESKLFKPWLHNRPVFGIFRKEIFYNLFFFNVVIYYATSWDKYMDYFLSSTIPIQSLKSFNPRTIFFAMHNLGLYLPKLQFTQIQKHWSKGNQEGVFVCFVFFGGGGQSGNKLLTPAPSILKLKWTFE